MLFSNSSFHVGPISEALQKAFLISTDLFMVVESAWAGFSLFCGFVLQTYFKTLSHEKSVSEMNDSEDIF